MYRTHFEQIHPSIFEIAPDAEGPAVLVTVGLHPDEAGHIFGGMVQLVRTLLARGRVVLAHCFPPDLFPHATGSRFVGAERSDPNRSFTPHFLVDGTDAFSDRLRVLSQCIQSVDVVVDLHRYTKDDGGPVALPFDERGAELARKAGIPMLVHDLVSAIEGAFSLHAARAGKLPLVIEVGPRSPDGASDRNALSCLVGVLRALGMVAPEDHIGLGTRWPDGPSEFKLLRAIRRSELHPELLAQIGSLSHMAALPPALIADTGLPGSARLLMVNPEADPAAYACVPV